MLFPKDLRANLTFFGVEIFEWKGFCASYITPMRETLIETKVSLLYVAKKIKFVADNTLIIYISRALYYMFMII